MKEKIQKIASEFLAESSSYLVEVREKSDRIVVVLDGFSGVDIRTCSRLSRHINRLAEEDAEIGEYAIEVTSAGVGSDLSTLNQLKANVGRLVNCKTQQSEHLTGRLIGVDSQYIYLSDNKNITEQKQSEIKSIKVEIEF
ncbi:hypothetical protein GC194_02215 [bacterium]|nr:hypothetical protein [bacterium]